MALALIFLFVTIFLITFLAVWGAKRHRKSIMESEDHLSDRELLLLMDAEPDGIINATSLARKSGLSIGQARKRLHRLVYAGVVNQMSSGLKQFYELKAPIEKRNLIDLSDKPYISIEDLFTLFDHYGNKMTMQDICIATGLPFKVIKEEMKYFQKEGVVHEMTQHVGIGHMASKFYTLQDAYKNNRPADNNKGEAMNLDLEKIYQRIQDNDSGFV